MTLDPRLTPARPDLAAEHLKDEVAAPRYAVGQRHQIAVPLARLHRLPDHGTPPDTELLCGEEIDVYDIADGWAWGQSRQDGYVGYLPERSVRPGLILPTHRVATHSAPVYRVPELKTPTDGALGFGALIRVVDESGGYSQIAGVQLDGEWLATRQLRPLHNPEPDWVAVAERFLGVPYIWGGRSSLGLDCSALVQLARQAAGHECPRDSDMQEAALGQTLPDSAGLNRGDLIFWKGHVGIMTDAGSLLHANAHHMAVATEPLAGAIQRIEQAGDGRITRRARLDAAPFDP